MTVLKLYKKGGRYIGFRAEGHAGYAASGRDIVCAAVSAALQLACIEAREVLGLELEEFCADENKARIVCIAGEGAHLEAWEPALKALELFFRSLEQQYRGHVEVLILEV